MLLSVLNKYFMNYYYNNVPGKGLVRNNLIYTSLINKEKTVFCKWYYNDTDYHKDKNKVVDPEIMDSKWERELKYLTFMSNHYPEYIPEILEIDLQQRKIFLKIDGVDFWQQHYDNNCTFDQLLPDWQDQLVNLFKIYKENNFYKYSIHPSSYFIVNGKLKSINYFFCHSIDEKFLTINQIKSHISEERFDSAQLLLQKYSVIDFDQHIPLNVFNNIILDSFESNYPAGFIDKLRNIF